MLIEPYSALEYFVVFNLYDTKLMSEPGRLRVGIRQYKGLIWTIGKTVWKMDGDLLCE